MPETVNRRRIWVSAAAIALSAVLLAVETTLWKNKQYYLTSVIIILLAFAMLFARFERRRPQAREVVILAVMTALALAGRAACAR